MQRRRRGQWGYNSYGQHHHSQFAPPLQSRHGGRRQQQQQQQQQQLYGMGPPPGPDPTHGHLSPQGGGPMMQQLGYAPHDPSQGGHPGMGGHSGGGGSGSGHYQVHHSSASSYHHQRGHGGSPIGFAGGQTGHAAARFGGSPPHSPPLAGGGYLGGPMVVSAYGYMGFDPVQAEPPR